MRLILIALVVVCGLGFAATKVYGFFSEKKNSTPESLKAERDAMIAKEFPEYAAKEKELKEAPAAVPADSVHALQASVPAPPTIAGAPVEALTISSYRFKNRVAPVAPAFLRADDARVIVETDIQSNSWVWMGSPVFQEQIQDLARAFDKAQVEMDLEFVLVLISRDKLKAKGISVFYQEKASFLDVLNLSGDSGSLRISSGGWSLGLDLANTTSGVSLLSQPVIRCMDGNAWKFATDTQVPIPRSEYVDGVLRQVVEYRPIGFGLDGTVRIVGNKVLLDVKQRNGSVTPASSDRTNDAPVFQDQILETSLHLAFGEWSVMGGIQVDKEQSRKGLFRDSLQVTNDYLVIFVRPKLSLEAPPRAVPVKSGLSWHPLGNVPFDLLPEKGWQDFPDGVVIDAMPIPAK